MIEQIARAIADTRGQEFDALSGSYAGRVCLVQIMREAQAILPLIEAAVMAERERCAGVAEQQAQEFLSPQYAVGQPSSSFNERFACSEVAKAIRSQP